MGVRVPPSAQRSQSLVEALRGAGLDIALALLESPEESHGVQALARRLGRSPGRVSEILAALRSQGLACGDNRPMLPELFWATAEEWRPRWIPIPVGPPPEPPERYRLSGTFGAVALGAPIAAGPEGIWPKLYVVDDTDLTTVVGAYGATSGWTGCEIAVCPSRFRFRQTSPTYDRGYLVASDLVVALDLAQDRARGREVLERWEPDGTPRVW